MTERPPLSGQIEAVELAEHKAGVIGRDARMRPSEIDLLRRRLAAAAETLRTLEFGSAIAR